MGLDDGRLPPGRIPPSIAALLQRREEGEFVARIALPLSWLTFGAGIIIRAAPRPALAIVPVLLLCASPLALARRPSVGTESR